MDEREKSGQKKVWIIAAIVVCVLMLGGLTAVVGGGIWLMDLGLEVVSQQVANDLEDNPLMQEHVGLVQTIEIDFSASAAEPNENVFVFDVQGSKGSAVLVVETITTDAGSEDVTWGRLKLPSGDVHDLIEGQGPKPE